MASAASEDLETMQYTDLSNLELLGSGGYGDVYRAKHDRHGIVAYKELNARKLGERIVGEPKKEARMNVLTHINIITLLAIIMEIGHYGLVMEYVLHGALNDFILTYYMFKCRRLEIIPSHSSGFKLTERAINNDHVQALLSVFHHRLPIDALTGPEELLSFARKWITQCWEDLPDDRPLFDDLEMAFAEIKPAKFENSVASLYLQKPIFVKTLGIQDLLPQPVSHEGNENNSDSDDSELYDAVAGVTVIGNVMYVVYEVRSVISRYDVSTSTQLGVIRVDGMIDPRDIVSCHQHHQLYVADCWPRVWRVSVADGSYIQLLSSASLRDTCRPVTLSITSCHLLVTSESPPALHEFREDGELLCDVKLPQHVRVLHHAVETSHSTFVICHQSTAEDERQCAVSEIDKQGNILSTFSDISLWWPPWYLSLDSEDNVVVADLWNHRMLLLTSQLQQHGVLTVDMAVELWTPCRLHYDDQTSHVYVAHSSSSESWLRSDVITILKLCH